MLCWAFKANFTNFRRRTTQVSSFHDMRVEKPANERKCVTHVYAHCVTQVCAPCREGRLWKCLNYASGSVLIFARTLNAARTPGIRSQSVTPRSVLSKVVCVQTHTMQIEPTVVWLATPYETAA